MLVANRRRRFGTMLTVCRRLSTDTFSQCDTAQPSCSRCSRLSLPCTGNGKRRFKFITFEETITAKSINERQTSGAVVKLTRYPMSNNVTRLATSFISGLQTKDPRFDMSCYGIFLPEIPKRLGTHPALDASAAALVCAYPAVHNRQPSCEALTKYGRALHVLRLALDKPDNDKVVELLCAIYFLLICQVCRAPVTFRPYLTVAIGLDFTVRRQDYQPR